MHAMHAHQPAAARRTPRPSQRQRPTATTSRLNKPGCRLPISSPQRLGFDSTPCAALNLSGAAHALAQSTACRKRQSSFAQAVPPKDSAGDVASTSSSSGGSSSSTSSSSSSSGSGSGTSTDVFNPEFAKGLLEELQDASQLGQRGEGWTVAQFVALGLVVLPPFHSTELTSVIGVLLLLGGSAAIVSGLQNLGAALTPLPMPRKDSQLVTSGVYGYMRHPMYGGLLAASLGLAAVTHDEARLLAAAVLWAVLEQKVAYEEQLLVQRYGAAYEEYQKAVKKFFPYVY